VSHRQLHQAGNEVAWWEKLKFKPQEVAKGLWEENRKELKLTAIQIAQK
jgi:precorrin-6B methylase 1